jgi:hypothetical protein
MKLLQNILDEGELSPAATVKDYLTVRTEGARQVERLSNCLASTWQLSGNSG